MLLKFNRANIIQISNPLLAKKNFNFTKEQRINPLSAYYTYGAHGYKCAQGHIHYTRGVKKVLGEQIPKCKSCPELNPISIEVFECELCFNVVEGEWNNRVCQSCLTNKNNKEL